jgi:hypothetical protein
MIWNSMGRRIASAHAIINTYPRGETTIRS